MPTPNVDIMRSVYEATAQDMYAVLDVLAPDAEWHTEAGGPLESVYIGPEGARRWLEQMEAAFDDYRIEPEKFVAEGEYVIVPVRVWARAKDTGIEAEVPIVHVWLLRDGRVVWTRSYPSEQEALEGVRSRG